jgi:hypothetical protein
VNHKQYTDNLDKAVKALNAAGKTTLEDHLYALGGIYYATTWSVEYVKLKADDRRKAFERCLDKTYSAAENPTTAMGPGLFTTLFKNQDITVPEALDVGHMMIGLAARLRKKAREDILTIADLGGVPVLPSFVLSTKSTGLEILTWVGDLGGATGRLALDRADAAAKASSGKPVTVPASKYFTGKDYGGPSNLRGDVYAYALASSPGPVDYPEIGPPRSSPVNIAEAFRSFFPSSSEKSKACATFLSAIGGTFAGGSMTNQAAVETTMADKFEAFGSFYIVSYLKTFVVKVAPPPPPPPKPGFFGQVENLYEQAKGAAGAAVGAGSSMASSWLAARPFMRAAAEDVAKLFMSKLLANNLG